MNFPVLIGIIPISSCSEVSSQLPCYALNKTYAFPLVVLPAEQKQYNNK